MTTPSDEIDFEPILEKVFTYFKKKISSILSFFPFVFKNFIQISFGGLLGALVLFGLSHILKPYYRINMAISSTSTGKVFLDQTILGFDKMLKDENYVVLSEKLNLSIEETKEIKSLTAVQTDVYRQNGDSSKNEYIYYILSDVYSEGILENLQRGLLKNLENNPFAARKREDKRYQLTKSVTHLQNDILALDSIIIKVKKNLGSKNIGSTFVLNEPMRPAELILEKNRLFYTLISFENQLKHLVDIQLITPFDPTYDPFFPKKKWFALIGFLIGAFSTMIFIATKSSHNNQ